MKIYLVGGAVRDKLLGLPVKERDWVVVGATIEDMLGLGYRQVGKEFPVFLHPKTHEEYALARMERKVKPGYKGFTVDVSPDVTLEEDLRRRDLTINAMAEDNHGKLIDPFNGKKDLENRILRHVSISFKEDPVRILRVARFLARYASYEFQVAQETIELMQEMVHLGEVNALVAERVWKEFQRALTEKNPEKFFEVLAQCNALPILFPNFLIDGMEMKAITSAKNMTDDPVVRFAVLYAQTEGNKKNTIKTICDRYKVPNEYRHLAVLTATHYTHALHAKNYDAQKLLDFFNQVDIFRREQRFEKFLLACEAIASSQSLEFSAPWLRKCAHAAKSYPVKELVDQGLVGNELTLTINKKRLEKIEEWLRDN